MSHVPTLSLHLDEERYQLLSSAAKSRNLNPVELLNEIVVEFLAEESAADEVLRREGDARSPITLEEMRRRLAS